MNVSHENRFKLLVKLSQLGLVLTGVCLLAGMTVMFGLCLFLFMEEPRGLAARILPDSQRAAIVEPQPQLISPSETNIVIVDPRLARGYLSGVASQAAIWANGKSFESGGAAAWEICRAAWRLWLLGIAILAAGRFLNRFRRTPPQPPTKSKGFP